MIIIRDTTDFYLEKDTVAAIGKFDGIHRGHEKILRKMREYKAKGLKLAIFTFAVHPSGLLGNEQKVITTREEKRRIFESFEVDYLIEFPFYEQTAAIPAATFIEDILISRMRVKTLVCGPDLRFGHKGTGDVKLLKKYEQEGSFSVFVVEKELYKAEVISSSRIRRKILSGSMEEANAMLVVPFMFYGEVVHGRKLGRTIGIPTVNLLPKEEKLMPKSGVYYSRVRHLDIEYRSVTNIGIKPTVVKQNGIEKTVKGVETYIYNFDQEIYGDELLVFIHHFVRPEMNFKSLKELQTAMQRDIDTGLTWHAQHL